MFKRTFIDKKRHQVRHADLAIFGTLCIGVSFGLPIYLYFKEQQQPSVA
jgi:hypothetical protein